MMSELINVKLSFDLIMFMIQRIGLLIEKEEERLRHIVRTPIGSCRSRVVRITHRECFA